MRRPRPASLAVATLCLLAAAPVLPWPAIPHAAAQSRWRTLLDSLRGSSMPDGIAKTNGRIEATEVDVGTKYAGQLQSVAVNEGDSVTKGQVVATISAPEIEAQLRGAQAATLRARQGVAEAQAQVAARTGDVETTRVDLDRTRDLAARGFASQQDLDRRRNEYATALANLNAAVATREAAAAAVTTAESEVDRLQATLNDLVLRAPVSGRVQYRLARTGEVVGAGTRVLTLLDLSDVYMTIFLPAADAGRLAIGDEARIILDPAPSYVIPATIGFVATEAQFTPKTVETADERAKLMFRVKLQVPPDVLAKYARYVKTGVRGLGFVRTRAGTAWPDRLAVKLP